MKQQLLQSQTEVIELQSKLSEAVPFKHTLTKVIQERDMLQRSLGTNVNLQSAPRPAAQVSDTEEELGLSKENT